MIEISWPSALPSPRLAALVSLGSAVWVMTERAGLEGKNWEHLLLPESSQHFVPRSFVPTNKTYSLEHSRVCSLTWKWGRALGPYWVRAGS